MGEGFVADGGDALLDHDLADVQVRPRGSVDVVAAVVGHGALAADGHGLGLFVIAPFDVLATFAAGLHGHGSHGSVGRLGGLYRQGAGGQGG